MARKATRPATHCISLVIVTAQPELSHSQDQKGDTPTNSIVNKRMTTGMSKQITIALDINFFPFSVSK